MGSTVLAFQTGGGEYANDVWWENVMGVPVLRGCVYWKFMFSGVCVIDGWVWVPWVCISLSLSLCVCVCCLLYTSDAADD